MKKFTLAVMAVLTVTAIHTAGAANASEYSSKAALFGRPQEVTIGVLADQPGATRERAAAVVRIDPSNYSSRKALMGARKELTIAVLADTSAVEQATARPSAVPRAVSVDRYNTKKALGI